MFIFVGGGVGGVVLHTKYCPGDKIITDEVCGVCGIVAKGRVLTRI